MGTAKRERQKAGRQARLEAQEAEQTKAKRKQLIIRGGILLVAFIVVAFVISRLVASDDGRARRAGPDRTLLSDAHRRGLRDRLDRRRLRRS